MAVSTLPLQELPGLDDIAAESQRATGGAAADGTAAGAEAEEPLEDEFDLADLMAEEIEDSGVGGSKADRLAAIDVQLRVRLATSVCGVGEFGRAP